MKNTSVLFLAALTPVVMSVRADEGSTILDGGWRISVGAGYDSGVKSNFRFTPRSTYVSPLKRRAGMLDQETAKKQGWGETSADGKTTYNNAEKGKTSWTKANRDFPEESDRDLTSLEAYSISTAVYDRDTGAADLGSASYDRIDFATVADDVLAFSDSDEAAMPSVYVELSRNLYYNKDYHFGVELAFAFQYERRNDIFGARDCRVSGSSTLKTGEYRTTGQFADAEHVSFIRDFWDDLYAPFDSIGKDAEDDPTPEGFTISRTQSPESVVASDTGYCMTSAHGDYEDIEMMLLLRPYYDVFDWLRINLMGGMVVSRQDLDFSMSVLQAESTYRLNRDYSQWDVYGIAGGGIMLRRWDFTLSADFLARFLDNDLSVDNDYVHGTVERGRWMFRVALGYEF